MAGLERLTSILFRFSLEDLPGTIEDRKGEREREREREREIYADQRERGTLMQWWMTDDDEEEEEEEEAEAEAEEDQVIHCFLLCQRFLPTNSCKNSLKK